MISKILRSILGGKEDVKDIACSTSVSKDCFSNSLSIDMKNRVTAELSSFAIIAEDIRNKEKICFDELNSKNIELTRGSVSQLLQEALQMKHQYMKELNESKAYKEILPWVSEEVYKRFVIERIESEERWQKLYPDRKPSDKITKAKNLVKKDPEAAAELFFQLGTCHSLWGLQRSILKEEFNVTWYSPAELHPDTCFD